MMRLQDRLSSQDETVFLCGKTLGFSDDRDIDEIISPILGRALK